MVSQARNYVSRAKLLLAPAGLILLALLLRLLGIWWGLPTDATWERRYFSFHPDEIFLLLPAFGFEQGDWNPHFFNYGTLYLYLVGLPAVLFRLVPDSVRFPQGLAPLYLLGRMITALLGTATVLILYQVWRKEDRSLALYAAFLLAICPLHVINSHYATVDVPATFFITLAFLLTLRGLAKPDWKTAGLAGLAVGLAAATKYNAGLFLMPILLAPLLSRPAGSAGASPTKLMWYPVVTFGALLGFVIGTPYIGSPEFLRGFLFEWRHAQAGGTLAFVNTGPGWIYHLLRGLPFSLGYPLLVGTLVGLIISFKSRSPALRLSLLWIIFYLFFIGFSRERFIRYLVPIMPFICLIAAAGLLWMKQHKRTWKVAAIIIMISTTLYSLGQLFSMGIAEQQMAWIQIDSDILHAHPEYRIGLINTPWYYHPPVSPYNAGEFSKPFFEAWNKEHGDRIIVTGWDKQALAASPPEVFITSDLETADSLRLRDPAALEFTSELDRLYPEKRTFTPFTPFAWLAPPRALAPPDWLYTTPRITVYHSPKNVSA